MAEMGSSANLAAAAIALGLENTQYEPEQFPRANLPPRKRELYRYDGFHRVTLNHWDARRRNNTPRFPRRTNNID